MVTFLAPPHCVFLMVLPALSQRERCLQKEPSPMPKWNSRSQLNSGMMLKATTEKASMSAPAKSQPKLGDDSFWGEHEPTMALPPVRGSRAWTGSSARLPKEEAHDHLSHLKPP